MRARLLLLFLLLPFARSQSEYLWEKPVSLQASQDEVRFEVPRFGRYALKVHSVYGASFETADRKDILIRQPSAGPENRADLFLDPGAHKTRIVRTRKDEICTFEALPFHSAGPIQIMESERLFVGKLEDFAYQRLLFRVEREQTLLVEALGRQLGACRIMTPSGAYLSDPFQKELVEAVSGQPMTRLSLITNLNPGVYELQCYGAPALEWSKPGEDDRFLARVLQQHWSETGLHETKLDASGMAHFFLPPGPIFIELSADQPQNATLRMELFSKQQPNERSRAVDQAMLAINKTPNIQIQPYAYDQEQHKFVSVMAEPGSRFQLRHFRLGTQFTVPEGNLYFLSFYHNRAATDAGFATGLLYKSSDQPQLIAQTAPHLSNQMSWRQRFNLNGDSEILLNFDDEGEYILEVLEDSTAKATFSLSSLPDYPVPNDSQTNYIDESTFTLPRSNELSQQGSKAANNAIHSYNFIVYKGLQVLRIHRDKSGILNLLFHSSSKAINSHSGPIKDSFLRENIFFPHIRLAQDDHFLSGGQRAGLWTGFELRADGFDLSQPLALSLVAGEEIGLHVYCPFPNARLRTSTEQLIFVGGTEESGQGNHQLRIKANSNHPVIGMVWAEPKPTPLSLADSPSEHPRLLPRVEQGKPLFLDLTDSETHALLQINEPGLYNVETNGRVAVALRVQTLAKPLLAKSQRENGSNALIQTYLTPGSYFVSARALDGTAGRVGIYLRRSAMTDTQPLREGERLLYKVPAGGALRMPFRISTAGAYQIEAQGLGKRFAYRLEDEQGWPLMLSDQATDSLLATFKPGNYFYWSLAMPIDTLREIRLTQPEPEFRDIDQNPNLAFGLPLRGLWRKDQPKEARFQLSVTASIHFRLSNGMKAEITLADKTLFRFEREWRGELKRGAYKIRLHRDEDDDRFPYELLVESDMLLPGNQQFLTREKAQWEMRVPKNTITTLITEGRCYLQAHIFDENHKRVSLENERKDGDWNLSLSEFFPEGSYQFALEKLQADEQRVSVKMLSHNISTSELPAFPFKRSWDFSQSGWSFTWTAEQDQFIQVKGLGLIWQLREDKHSLGRTSETLTAAIRKGKPYELTVWASDPRNLAEQEISGKILKIGEWKLGNAIPPKLDGLHIRQMNQRALQVQNARDPLSWINGAGIAQPLPASGILPCNQDIWLIGAQEPLQIQALKMNSKQSLLLNLGEDPLTLDFEWKEEAPGVLQLQGEGFGFAGHLEPFSEEPIPGFDWDNQALCEGQSLLGVPGKGRYRLKLWRTQPGSGALRLEPKTLRVKAAKPTKNRSFSLEAGEVAFLDWSANDPEQANRLLLGQGAGLFYWHGNEPGAFFFADGQGQEVLAPKRACRLYFFNLDQPAALIKLQSAAIATNEPTRIDLQANARFETRIESPMNLTIYAPSSSAEGFWLLKGSILDGDFLGDDGKRRTFPFTDLASVSGLFRLQVAEGLLSIRHAGDWLDGQGLFDLAPEAQTQIEANKIIDLALLEQAWRFEISQPSLVRVLFDQPGAVALLKDKRPIQAILAESGENRRILTPLEPGTYELWTRPLAGLRNPGHAVLKLQDPIPFELDKKSEPRLIADGEVQVYRFQVQNSESFGIGIQAERGKITGQLWRVNGELLANGPFYFGQLPAGDYFFAVENQGEPASYQLVSRLSKLLNAPPDL